MARAGSLHPPARCACSSPKTTAMIGESRPARPAAGRLRRGLGAATDAPPSSRSPRTSTTSCVLDLGLPRKEGLDVLRAMRRRGDARPVLIVTARDAVADRVAGLDAGADDYVVKPFELTELAARIRALLRRSAGRAEPVVAFGDIELDPGDARGARARRTRSRCRRASSRCSKRCSRGPAPSCRARSSRKSSTAGTRRSTATRSKSTSTRCAASCRADTIRNVRGVGWTIAQPERRAADDDRDRSAASSSSGSPPGLLVAIAVAAVATYLRAREEANEIFDYQLRQMAASLTGVPLAGTPGGLARRRRRARRAGLGPRRRAGLPVAAAAAAAARTRSSASTRCAPSPATGASSARSPATRSSRSRSR